MRIVAFGVAAAALVTQLARPVQRELENVEAFARLYGVIRYFYPSDAAAALDWNRFAVYGAGQVRKAVDSAILERTLESLFEPLGPGIVLGTTLPASPALGTANASLVAWRYDGPGGMGSGAGAYTAGRLNRAGRPTADAFVAMAQGVPAADSRGKRIRLTARVRVPNPDLMGWAGLWLRVDRPNQQFGFFDNMQNRPIRSSDWREYVIEGPVADDATSIIIGALTSGVLTTEYDAFELSALTGDTWVPIPIHNAGFEEDTGVPPSGWQRMGTASAPTVTVETSGAAAGRRFLRLTSSTGAPAPAVKGVAVENAHVDVDLASGLKARVRLSLTDEEARATTPGIKGLLQAISSVRDPNRSEMDVQLADVVVAWNVFRHFYPYWEEAGVDWDARLRGQLLLAAAAQDRRGHHDALRVLVAEVRDGHGGVTDTTAGQTRAFLPIQIASVDRQFVIIASARGEEAPIGSIVTTIGQRSTSDIFQEGMRLTSGTAQWREARTLREMVSCSSESKVTIAFELGGGQTREVALSCTAPQLVAEARPEAISQVANGYWYVDLTRATRAQVTPMLQTLATARGLVFDVRGYPTDAGFTILPHLIDAPESDRWMHVPHITGPFMRVERWQSAGWNLQPATPPLPARRVFLTDGRAISYAESVMGYVADRDLATIVGGPTAGANGNVATAALPGGFAINFTGMRVTGHDGSTPFHLRGVTPDVSLQRTLAGIRAGRDELLERALELLGAR